MNRLIAFSEFRDEPGKSRVLTYAGSELAPFDARASSNALLDPYRQSPSQDLPPLEYSRWIAQAEIQNDLADRGKHRDIGTAPRQIDLFGQALRDRLVGRPRAARLSTDDLRLIQTARPRVDLDRRRAERLFAGSNFRQSQADSRF